jgi:hypothetical protein
MILPDNIGEALRPQPIGERMGCRFLEKDAHR